MVSSSRIRGERANRIAKKEPQLHDKQPHRLQKLGLEVNAWLTFRGCPGDAVPAFLHAGFTWLKHKLQRKQDDADRRTGRKAAECQSVIPIRFWEERHFTGHAHPYIQKKMIRGQVV
jgi:hypothetical protein